jgi:hypothetical protein
MMVSKTARALCALALAAAVSAVTGCCAPAPPANNAAGQEPGGMPTIAVPNPGAPAGAARNAVDGLNQQTNSVEQQTGAAVGAAGP